MTKRIRSSLLAATLLTPLLLSSQAEAISDAAFSQQVAAIQSQRAHLAAALAEIKDGWIAEDLRTFVGQMDGVLWHVTEIVALDVPAGLTRKWEDCMTAEQGYERTKQRESFVEELNENVAEIDGKISIDGGQMKVISMATQLAALQPPDNIRLLQSGFLAQAAALEQAQRSMASDFLRRKQEDLLAELDRGDGRAADAEYARIMTGTCE